MGRTSKPNDSDGLTIAQLMKQGYKTYCSECYANFKALRARCEKCGGRMAELEGGRYVGRPDGEYRELEEAERY